MSMDARHAAITSKGAAADVMRKAARLEWNDGEFL
jgi:hypothetical protein